MIAVALIGLALVLFGIASHLRRSILLRWLWLVAAEGPQRRQALLAAEADAAVPHRLGALLRWRCVRGTPHGWRLTGRGRLVYGVLTLLGARGTGGDVRSLAAVRLALIVAEGGLLTWAVMQAVSEP